MQSNKKNLKDTKSDFDTPVTSRGTGEIARLVDYHVLTDEQAQNIAELGNIYTFIDLIARVRDEQQRQKLEQLTQMPAALLIQAAAAANLLSVTRPGKMAAASVVEHTNWSEANLQDENVVSYLEYLATANHNELRDYLGSEHRGRNRATAQSTYERATRRVVMYTALFGVAIVIGYLIYEWSKIFPNYAEDSVIHAAQTLIRDITRIEWAYLSLFGIFGLALLLVILWLVNSLNNWLISRIEHKLMSDVDWVIVREYLMTLPKKLQQWIALSDYAYGFLIGALIIPAIVTFAFDLWSQAPEILGIANALCMSGACLFIFITQTRTFKRSTSFWTSQTRRRFSAFLLRSWLIHTALLIASITAAIVIGVWILYPLETNLAIKAIENSKHKFDLMTTENNTNAALAPWGVERDSISVDELEYLLITTRNTLIRGSRALNGSYLGALFTFALLELIYAERRRGIKHLINWFLSFLAVELGPDLFSHVVDLTPIVIQISVIALSIQFILEVDDELTSANT